MEEIKQSLANLKIGAAQKAFIYAVLQDLIPCSYVDIYINSDDKNAILNFFGKANLVLAEVNIFGGERHLARIAFAKTGEITQQLAEALEEHMEAKASHLMGEPDSLHYSQKVILNRRAYPADIIDNPLCRLRLTKGGMAEEVAYVRMLMNNLKTFPELAKEFELEEFEKKREKEVVV